jgi:hypothetical protein
MNSRQVGITIYSLMSFLHFVTSIIFYSQGNMLGAFVQLAGSAIWLYMISFDTSLEA